MQLSAPTTTTDPTQTVTTPASGTSGSSSTSASSSLTGSTDPLTNESTFLQLLITQVQNQDPTDPADPEQFVGELVEFSQLEQLLNINQGVQSLVTDATPPSSTNNGSTQSTGAAS